MKHHCRTMHIGCFFIAVLFAAAAGVYREVNDKERIWLTFDLPQQQEQLVSIDLAQQGVLKYYLQPGQISLYIRGKMADVSDSALQIQFSGITGNISQASKKGNWEQIGEQDLLSVRENGILPICVELDMSRASTRRYEVGRAFMTILQNKRVIYISEMRIVNSNYADPARRKFNKAE